jgi:hypothetical protein
LVGCGAVALHELNPRQEEVSPRCGIAGDLEISAVAE